MNLAARATRATWRLGRFSVMSAAMLVVSLLLGPLAHGGPGGPTLGAWHPASWREVPAASAGEGVATVTSRNGRSHLITRGDGNIPAVLSARGWWHIGDPGSRRGYLLDPYQGHPAMHAKLFVLTTPSGQRSEWIHQDSPGEMTNNSFAAIAPSGQWFVGGEWGEVHRLLVYPTPVLNPATRHDRHHLPLATTIALTRPLRDVQGCSFTSPTAMLCATNDPDTDLFPVPHQLLRINLTHPLNGHRDVGIPHALGTIPQHSRCPGVGEVEGVDVFGSRLTIVVNEPNLCHGRSVLLRYARRPGSPSSDTSRMYSRHPGSVRILVFLHFVVQYFSALGQRPSKTVANTFRAGFHRVTQRLPPLPVGSRLRVTR